jgi:peptide/nickel transport system permease protein
MAQAVEVVADGAEASPSLVRLSWARVLRAFRQWPVLPVAVLAGLVVIAVLVPPLSPYDPIKGYLEDRLIGPFWTSDGDWSHPLGTDNVGRDVLNRLAHGARVSLSVAVVALVSGTVIGTTLGLMAGYFGGLADETIMRVVDVWFAFPFLLIALLISVVVGASLYTIMGLLVLLAWPSFVRYVRVEVLTLKERDYVAAARIAGAGTGRILLRHILPGTINTVAVVASLRVGQLILAEASLSFLGAGIPPPRPSWGIMISDGRQYIREAWWITVFPGLAVFLLVYAFNFLGDWLRDRIDPRLRQAE